MYANFPLVISERWQAEVAETVFDTVNQETDKLEAKRKAKHRKFDLDEKGWHPRPPPPSLCVPLCAFACVGGRDGTGVFGS